MIYYELKDCSNTISNIFTDVDLASYGIQINSVFLFQSAQDQQYFCFQLVNIVDLDIPPDPLFEILPTNSNYVNCAQCLSSIISGCMNPEACNYNPSAIVDDGSCFYNRVTIRILCNDPITTCSTNSNCE